MDPAAQPFLVEIPDFAMVVLVGASSSGKSTLARRFFGANEVLSSDGFRELVAGDANSMEATRDAMEVLHDVLDRRLARRLLTVVDTTALYPQDRQALLEIGRKHYAPCIAVVLDTPLEACLANNLMRGNPRKPESIERMVRRLSGQVSLINKEKWTKSVRLHPRRMERLEIRRTPLRTDLRHLTGPFDIVGDVHGCTGELRTLLRKLGYQPLAEGDGYGHPEGRLLTFVGDLTDRGPDPVGTLRLAVAMLESGTALWSMGNHDIKLQRWLAGREQNDHHGFGETRRALEAEFERDPQFRHRLQTVMENVPSHLALAGGQLVVAHAGIRPEMVARATKAVMDFCVFGETTGEVDGFGFQVRMDWARGYKGGGQVVWGHVAHQEVSRIGDTLCIDTGCCFGGALTALRWPEGETVSVPAEKVWSEPQKPLQEAADKPLIVEDFPALETAPADFKERLASVSGQGAFDMPDAGDILSMRRYEPRSGAPVTLDYERVAAAFQTVVRHGEDPRWLVHIPPTTAAVPGSQQEGWLERPEDALAVYARAGYRRVFVQEKHMGSRVVVVVTRDQATAREVFGDESGRMGAVMSRTGRAVFDAPGPGEPSIRDGFLDRVRGVLDESGFWEKEKTDWVVLDGELLPWSVMGAKLIEQNFLGVGLSAQASAEASLAALRTAMQRGVVVPGSMLARLEKVQRAAPRFHQALLAFSAPWDGTVEGLRFAPFHILAGQGWCGARHEHDWHMGWSDTWAQSPASQGLMRPTQRFELDPGDAVMVERIARWWEELTAGGGEGIVVKTPSLAAMSGKKPVAPIMKVRGREYLRLIYGMTYDEPDSLKRLQGRNVVRKRNLARMATSLGMESLELLAEGANLARRHAAVVASLALASEPVDAKL